VGRSGVRDDAIAAWVADRLQADAGRRFEKAGLTPTAVVFAEDDTVAALVVDPFEFSRARVGRRSPDQVRAWAWTVDDPERYVALVPVFPPRATDLVEPA
jgi:hypothetical protein